MKNYYEILEINENASQEIIEKVYKVLVKKYHPDLQEDAEAKAKCEEKIKEINEAYDVLSDKQKRADYNEKLMQEKERISQQNNNFTSQNSQAEYNYDNGQFNQNYSQQYRNSQSDTNFKNNAYGNINYEPQYNQSNQKVENEAQYQEELKRQRQYEQDYQNAINKAYHDAYIQDMKNRGYKIKYKKTKKDYLRSLISLLITIGIIMLIANLPFVQNYFKDLYNNNIAFKQIIDFFVNIFK